MSSTADKGFKAKVIATVFARVDIKGGNMPFVPEICTFFCTCHNFFLLSSVQIIIIPACCLLCVL